jgi:hypothetical protein
LQEELEKLLAAYRPGVDPISRAEGNVAMRGFNRGVRRSILVLGLAGEDELDEMLDELDARFYAERAERIRGILETGQVE